MNNAVFQKKLCAASRRKNSVKKPAHPVHRQARDSDKRCIHGARSGGIQITEILYRTRVPSRADGFDRVDSDRVPSMEGNQAIQGITAGVAEMLLQSHAGEIEFLPALPKAWPNGSIKGLRARGGFEVDLVWKEGKLANATIRSLLGKPCRIRSGGKTVELSTRPGHSYHLDGQLNRAGE